MYDGQSETQTEIWECTKAQILLGLYEGQTMLFGNIYKWSLAGVLGVSGGCPGCVS